MHVDLVCHHCGNPFKRKRKSYNTSIRLGRKNSFCNQICLHNWQKEKFKKERKPIAKNTREKFPKGKKQCSRCKELKELDGFVKGKRLRNLCRICLYEYQKERWVKRKLKAIEYLGGKCKHCGFHGHSAAFDFHHRDPKEKDMEWHKMKLRKWQSVLKELDKCDLLCSNCHRIEHATRSKTDS